MDDAGSKCDGGDVPFAGGAQAENEPQSATIEAGLIGMRDDGRIEESGGFQGVFSQEIGADQEASLLGHLHIPWNQFPDLFEAFQGAGVDLVVPAGELSAKSAQERTEIFFRERHDSGDYAGCALVVAWIEGPQENPRLVRTEDRGLSPETY
jgi:hypothetical protein